MAYAGLFNEPIQIYDQTTKIGDYGERSTEMTLTYSTRAKVSHISGNRTVIDDEIQTPYDKKFVVRIYVPVLDTSWIKYNDKYYRVTCIDKDKDLQQTVILTQLVNE